MSLDVQTALGTLAADMGLDPDAALVVPAVTATPLPTPGYDESVAALIDEVKLTHPAVRAAQAQFEAAQSKVAQTRAEGLPNVTATHRRTQSPFRRRRTPVRSGAPNRACEPLYRHPLLTSIPRAV